MLHEKSHAALVRHPYPLKNIMIYYLWSEEEILIRQPADKMTFYE